MRCLSILQGSDVGSFLLAIIGIALLSLCLFQCHLAAAQCSQGRNACIMLPTLTYHDVSSYSSYIKINVSETHSGDFGKSTAHVQNIISTLIKLGFFDMFRFGGIATGKACTNIPKSVHQPF